MKYSIALLALVLFSCSKLPHSVVEIKAEKARYKMFVENEDGLSQTPAELYVSVFPVKGGFIRTQTLEAPGVAFIDTLKMDYWGHPLKQVYIQGNRKIYVTYTQEYATVVTPEETLPYPIDSGSFDALQLDLLLRGMDTLKNRSDIPVFSHDQGGISYFEFNILNNDTIRQDYISSENIAVSHRYAITPGEIYEGWYAREFLLPIKTRITTAGVSYVFWKLGDKPVKWQ